MVYPIPSCDILDVENRIDYLECRSDASMVMGHPSLRLAIAEEVCSDCGRHTAPSLPEHVSHWPPFPVHGLERGLYLLESLQGQVHGHCLLTNHLVMRGFRMSRLGA